MFLFWWLSLSGDKLPRALSCTRWPFGKNISCTCRIFNPSPEFFSTMWWCELFNHENKILWHRSANSTYYAVTQSSYPMMLYHLHSGQSWVNYRNILPKWLEIDYIDEILINVIPSMPYIYLCGIYWPTRIVATELYFVHFASTSCGGINIINKYFITWITITIVLCYLAAIYRN